MKRLLASLVLLLAACHEGVPHETTPPPPAVPAVCTERVDGGVPSGQFPGAACTGPVEGSTLTPSPGFTVTEAGAVVENLDVSGSICVAADNVTIRNTRVTGGTIVVANGLGHGWCNVATGAQNLQLVDVEVRPNSSDSVAIEGAIYRPGIVCLRCDLHRAGAGIAGGHYALAHTFIHDLLGETDCTRYPVDCISHNDGIQIGGAGGDVLVTQSNIEGTYAPESTGGGMSCALCLYSHGDWGPMDNVTIEHSRIASDDAVYCAYGGDSGQQDPTNVSYVDNVFACPPAGAITAWLPAATNEWSGNRLADGTVIPEPGS